MTNTSNLNKPTTGPLSCSECQDHTPPQRDTSDKHPPETSIPSVETTPSGVLHSSEIAEWNSYLAASYSVALLCIKLVIRMDDTNRAMQLWKVASDVRNDHLATGLMSDHSSTDKQLHQVITTLGSMGKLFQRLERSVRAARKASTGVDQKHDQRTAQPSPQSHQF